MAQPRCDSIRNPKDRRIEKYVPTETIRMLPAMPITIHYCPLPVQVSFVRRGEEVTFRFLKEEWSQYDERLTLNSYSLRETFLEVRTPGEALDFLSGNGYFRHHRTEDRIHESLTWSDFQQWQEILRMVLSYGRLRLEEIWNTGRAVGVGFAVPDHLLSALRRASLQEMNWLQSFPDKIVIVPERFSPKDERQSLRAEIVVLSILDAMLASAYVDGLSGINYRLCALPDCNRLFEVQSKHERAYCSQACAHKASVRRKRAEQKALQDAAKSNTQNSEPKKGR